MRPSRRKQAQADAQLELTADGPIELGQQIEGLGDDAVGRVLDRNHSKVDLAALDRREDICDRTQTPQLRQRPELLAGRQGGEGALRPQVCDL